MASKQLVSVAISLTTLNLDLKKTLEPRTSSPQGRLRAVRNLSSAGIPVRVMAAPMIPMINDRELEHILKAAADNGAKHANYILVRLPYEVKTLFKEWLQTHFPDRAEHVMSLIKQMRGGKEYDSQFGKRMRGEGEFADLMALRFRLACKRYGLNLKPVPMLNTNGFKRPIVRANTNQMDLWDSIES
jgi:DNA repair photolyase